MRMQAYDVAVWIRWPALCPEYVEMVEAPGPLAAVSLVMLGYELEQAARVAVRLLSGGLVIRRWLVRLTEQGLEFGTAVAMQWQAMRSEEVCLWERARSRNSKRRNGSGKLYG